jgi:hypothetical protein
MVDFNKILSFIIRVAIFTATFHFSRPVIKSLSGFSPPLYMSLVAGVILTIFFQFYLNISVIGILSVILRMGIFTAAFFYSSPIWNWLIGVQFNLFWSLIAAIILTIGTQFYISAQQATIYELPGDDMTSSN